MILSVSGAREKKRREKLTGLQKSETGCAGELGVTESEREQEGVGKRVEI